jgi:peptidyl-prolyl cis-trans isomerase C
MKFLLASLVTAAALPVIAQKAEDQASAPLPPQTPLVVDGNVRVDAADFEGNILRVPADRRAGFRMSYERVATVIDNVYVTRSMAQKARDAGLDADPAVQARLRQLQDAYLADLYSQKLEKDAPDPNLEGRARELYAADRDKYLTDEEAHVQQILVGLSCRTNAQAREAAQRAYEEAKAGKEDFLALAAKYADPGEKALKGGDIGTGPVKRLVAPVREALAKLKKGEISEPVESQFGYHVLKLIDRKPAQPKPFDSVKKEIIAGEKARAHRKRIDDLVLAMRNSKTVVTYRENVEKLVTPGLDANELSQRARDAHKAPPATDSAKK